MYLLIVFLVAGFFGRFLGAEGTAIMTTGQNIVLFAILILGLIFLFRRYCFRLKKLYGFRLVFIIYISILLCCSFLSYFIRLYLLSRLGLGMNLVYPFLILTMVEALPAPSDPSSSAGWTDFDEGVLLEPFSETEMEGPSVNSSIPGVARDEAPGVVQNSSLESSMRNRIFQLENDNSLFLLDKGRQYWSEIKTALDQAPSQREYNRLLEFENRDLQIREMKHQAFSLFREVLSEHPSLAEKAYYNPQEAFIDFFDEMREEIETELQSADADRSEIVILNKIVDDISKNGPRSYYIKKILGHFDKDVGF